MRLNWSTQLMAVVGSFTAGEMAFKRDVDDLQDAELDILLQGAGRAEVERAAKIVAVLGRQPIPLGHHQQRDARRNELADSPEQRAPSRGRTSPGRPAAWCR